MVFEKDFCAGFSEHTQIFELISHCFVPAAGKTATSMDNENTCCAWEKSVEFPVPFLYNVKGSASNDVLLICLYPLYVDDNEEDWEMGLHAEKAEKAALLYEYVHENRESNYETPWSVWLAGRQSVE